MPTPAADQLRARFFAANPRLEELVNMIATVPGASVFVKDRQSRYISANSGTLTTYGLTDEADLIGRYAHDFFPPMLAAAYENEDRRVMESDEPVHNEIWLVPHIRGTPHWYISSKTPLHALDDSVIGLVGLMHPIKTPEAQQAHFQELQPVMEHIDRFYLEETSAAELAAIAGISVPHFNRRFRQLLRLSPMEYITSRRIQEAQRLLATTGRSVGHIANDTGFYDQSHFTKRFSQKLGMTPLKYRQRHRSPM